MVSYRCKNCDYRFSPKDKTKTDIPKICPYCNRKETLEKEKTANEILNEVTGSEN